MKSGRGGYTVAAPPPVPGPSPLPRPVPTPDPTPPPDPDPLPLDPSVPVPPVPLPVVAVDAGGVGTTAAGGVIAGATGGATGGGVTGGTTTGGGMTGGVTTAVDTGTGAGATSTYCIRSFAAPSPLLPPPPPPAGPLPPAPSTTSSATEGMRIGASAIRTTSACSAMETSVPRHPTLVRAGIPIGGRYGRRSARPGTGSVPVIDDAGSEAGGICHERYTAGDPERVRPPYCFQEPASLQLPVPPAAGAAASFGGTPMTFTPDPRATSIAQITSWYLTVGHPLTKMILSGRGS